MPPPPSSLQMDWLQLEPMRRQAFFCSLMLFQLPVCCTKAAAWWCDECTALLRLRCCVCLSLIKGSGAWRCQRQKIRLPGLSAETSARRCSSEGDVLQCGASSPRGSGSVRHNLFIYHIQDVSVPLTSRNIEPRRHKGSALTGDGLAFRWIKQW